LITAKLLHELVALTISAKADDLGCEGCFALVDQLAEIDLRGGDVPADLVMVRNHLAQCDCCADEYDALLTALRTLDESPYDPSPA
jgi:predicted anti-sigma-YlaC factor YlaD